MQIERILKLVVCEGVCARQALQKALEVLSDGNLLFLRGKLLLPGTCVCVHTRSFSERQILTFSFLCRSSLCVRVCGYILCVWMGTLCSKICTSSAILAVFAYWGIAMCLKWAWGDVSKNTTLVPEIKLCLSKRGLCVKPSQNQVVLRLCKVKNPIRAPQAHSAILD